MQNAGRAARVATRFDAPFSLVCLLNEFAIGQRRRVEIALDQTDALLTHHLELIEGLYPLCRRFHVECLGQPDNGSDDCTIARTVDCRTAHETLINLDLVEWRRLQIGE